MKLINCVNFKSERQVEELFKANSQTGYSNLMSVLEEFRSKLVEDMSKNGENTKAVDVDTLVKTTAQLSLCDQLLSLNAVVKARVARNTDD